MNLSIARLGLSKVTMPPFVMFHSIQERLLGENLTALQIKSLRHVVSIHTLCVVVKEIKCQESKDRNLN